MPLLLRYMICCSASHLCQLLPALHDGYCRKTHLPEPAGCMLAANMAQWWHTLNDQCAARRSLAAHHTAHEAVQLIAHAGLKHACCHGLWPTGQVTQLHVMHKAIKLTGQISFTP